MLRATLLGCAATVAISCSTEGPSAPEQLQLSRPFQAAVIGSGPAVRISEIHYDNTGTDVGEAIEISGPAGTNLTGWSLVLYNGNTATAAVPYTTTALTATIPTTCDQRGVVVTNYPSNGIQNGPTDGVALVNASGTVVEFLSYEGAITASTGAAAGLTSTNIGVTEAGTEAAGLSLQRNPNGTWSGPIANTFGACNDGNENGGGTRAVASVTVTPASATVVIGATLQLTGTALDSDGGTVAGAPLTWSTTADAIASVSNAGNVTGVAEGEARIIATSENGKADTTVITVEKPAPAGVRFSEIHYDNFGTDLNESIEIDGPAGTDVSGWKIHLYNGNGGVTYEPTKTLSGTIPEQCDGRGTLFVTYASNELQNGAPDGIALVNAEGAVVQFLSYEGVVTATNGPASGTTSTDIGAAQNSAPVGTSLHLAPDGTWKSEPANFGYCYGVTPPPPPNTITFSGRDNTDPALPVGFEDQLFATLRSGVDGSTIATTFTWTSETPLLASVDTRGVVRALGAGTMILKATASDGTSATYALAAIDAQPSATAVYAGNTEFGDPTDGDASDEIIIRRATYTTSFSAARGIPNWVSYNLEQTHFDSLDRCDCFTYDPELPAAQRYTTADYTGAGTVAGYGIDRGHLVRSFDRTAGALDNATTFYFSNIIPQAADNNQGPWARFENHLGDLARLSGREVYIIAGASGDKGTVKNEGRITIPTVTWKVAVVLPRNAGLASIDSWDDVQTVAVLMPNVAGIRNVAWETYQVTIDSIEAVSGFDVLASLRDDIEIAVESGTQPPEALLDGPWSAYAGDPLAMSGAGSTDADDDALTYAWEFGDGNTATGVTASHTYQAAGDYTVRLIVTDVRGLADTVTSTAAITLLPPAVGIARARVMVLDLTTAAGLTRGQVTSLLAKLDAAARSLERGTTTATRGQLEAFLNEIDAMVRSGRLTESQVGAIREVLGRTLRNL